MTYDVLSIKLKFNYYSNANEMTIDLYFLLYKLNLILVFSKKIIFRLFCNFIFQKCIYYKFIDDIIYQCKSIQRILLRLLK